MSLKATNWAWDLDLKPAQKLVLMSLADWANGKDIACEASFNQLASRCRMSRSTVIRTVEKLEELGLLERTYKTRKNGGKAKNDYRLMIGSGTSISDADDADKTDETEEEQTPDARCQNDTSRGVTDDTRVVSGVTLGKKHLGNEVTPQMPPKGGFSLEDKINSFNPGAALIDSLVAKGHGPEQCIRDMVPKWQAYVRERGTRFKSAASNFERWIPTRPDLRKQWLAEHAPEQPTTAKQAMTDDYVFSTAVGSYALENHVGRAFRLECEREGVLLGHDVVDQLVATRDKTHANPKDDIDRRCNRLSAEREKATTERWLKKAGAA